MKYFILLTAFWVSATPMINLHAQETFPAGKNYGLSEQQDPETLPYSRFDLRRTAVVSSTYHEPVNTSKEEYSLNQGWIVKADEPGAQEYNATVPGTILTTLVNQGVYENPYFGLNMMKIPDDLCRKNWIYTLKFKAPAQKNKNAFLHFEGINYMADVILNNSNVGRIEGAFQRGIFNVTDYLKADNELRVIIYPPLHPGIPHEQSARTNYGPNGGVLCLDGPTFISSEGWDWVPGIRDRNIGIWQDIKLSFVDDIRLSDMQIHTDLALPDTTEASLTVRVDVANLSAKKQKSTIELDIAGIRVSQQVELAPNAKRTIEFSPSRHPALRIKNPKLWWPNGYGTPYLHQATATSFVKGRKSDTLQERFGIRELSFELLVADASHTDKQVRVDYHPLNWLSNHPYPWDNGKRVNLSGGISIPTFTKDTYPEQMKVIKDNKNPYLVVKVNGRPIYCKGGNWGMDDAMKNVSRSKIEPYIKLHKDAGFTMIRNWTGESTEKVFFDLCDEYGILVWNDFWYSTLGFNLEPEKKELFMDNVKDVIVRYRNHPSLVIWCPRNEGYARPELETELVKATSELDGSRLYIGNSRYLNLRPSGPWNYRPDESVYFTQMARGFSTELGTMSVPLVSTMRKMMNEEDLWPISDTWYYHDYYNGKGLYEQTIDSLYGKAVSMPDFCKKAQMINYVSHRAMFEAWNSKLWEDTSGLLMWMSHPAWPSTVWQTYSSDYETTGAYFGIKKACEFFHIQMNAHNRSIAAINTTLKDKKAVTVSIKIYSLANTVLHSEVTTIDLNFNSCTQVPLSFMEKIKEEQNPFLVRLEMKEKEQTLSVNEYWFTGKSGTYQSFNELAYVGLRAEAVRRQGKQTVFKLSNPSQTPAIGVKVKVTDVDKDEEILPVFISDGYFALMPGEERIVTIDHSLSPNAPTYGIYVEGYNVRKGTIQTYN